MPSSETQLTCRLCGQPHRVVPLRHGRKACCVRCGGVLAKRPTRDAALAFALSGLILFVPAATLPLVVVGKFGRLHPTRLFSGVAGLWSADLRLLSVWVLLCGVLVPLLLLGTLVARLGRPDPPAGPASVLDRVAHACEPWAMPEVHVLAVLVAFVKLGSLVQVHVGLGLYCYAAMSVATLLAWRSFEFETAAQPAPPDVPLVKAAA